MKDVKLTLRIQVSESLVAQSDEDISKHIKTTLTDRVLSGNLTVKDVRVDAITESQLPHLM